METPSIESSATTADQAVSMENSADFDHWEVFDEAIYEGIRKARIGGD
jgi:hypothetical protein